MRGGSTAPSEGRQPWIGTPEVSRSMADTRRRCSTGPLPDTVACIISPLLQASRSLLLHCLITSGWEYSGIKSIAYRTVLEIQMFWIFCANVKPGCSHSVDGKAVQLCDCSPGMGLGIHAAANGVEKGLQCPQPLRAICTYLYFSSCSE